MAAADDGLLLAAAGAGGGGLGCWTGWVLGRELMVLALECAGGLLDGPYRNDDPMMLCSKNWKTPVDPPP